MKWRNKYNWALAGLLCMAAGLQGQEKKTLAVSDVSINPSVQTSVQQNGNTLAMQRVLESLNGQIETYFQRTRRYELVAVTSAERDALDRAAAENALVGAVQSFTAKGVDFILVTQVNDFQDLTKKTEMGGSAVALRTVRLGCVSKVISVASKSIVEIANFQLDDKHLDKLSSGMERSQGRASDVILLNLAEKMGERVAMHVHNFLSPPRVLAKTGPMVTINRGQGTDIERGQKFEVYAVGERLIDPDTGEDLGPNEIYIGMAQVVNVRPKFSQARLLEDFGVEKNAILRPMPEEDKD